MPQPLTPPTIEALARQIDAIAECLSAPALIYSPPEIRADVARSTRDQTIAPLWAALAALVDRRIDGQIPASRGRGSRTPPAEPCDAALREALPLAVRLLEIEATTTYLEGRTAPLGHRVPQTGVALEALANGAVERALRELAQPNDRDALWEEIERERVRLGDVWLRAAYAGLDQIQARRMREQPCPIEQNVGRWVRAIQRIGSERQRKQADWLLEELEAALSAKATVAPAAPESGRSIAPLAVKRRVSPVWMMVALSVLIVVVLISVALNSLSGYQIIIRFGAQPLDTSIAAAGLNLLL